MKSKAPLLLMEQVIMVLVFALGAALCLRVFAWAQITARDNAQQDRALVCVQNAAQTLKGCAGDYEMAARLHGGSWDGTRWTIGYDSGWTTIRQAVVYELAVTPVPGDQPLLGQAEVAVTRLADGHPLARLTVCWQEVSDHG